MSPITFDALDELMGEVLPERTVLGIVSTPFNNAGGGGGDAGGSASASSASSGGNVYADDGNSTVMSSCQSTYNPGEGSLLSDVGASGNTPNSSMTCTPAAANNG